MVSKSDIYVEPAAVNMKRMKQAGLDLQLPRICQEKSLLPPPKRLPEILLRV